MAAKKREVIEKARSIASKTNVCHLATTDGRQPQVRAMAFVPLKNGEIWFSTSAKSRKIKQLRKNPKAEVYFTDEKGFHCKIDGVCTISTKLADKKKQWAAQPELGSYFRNIDNPDFAIIRFKPRKYELMSPADYGYQTAEV